MKLSERLFNSHQFRPRPVIHQEADGSLLLIATAWGAPEAAQKVVDISSKYMQAARSDLEVTSPFEFLPQLTSEANALRVSALLANDSLYRTENKSDYSAVVEFLALSFKDDLLSWAQVGMPNLYIKKRNATLEPLSVSHDLSYEFDQSYHPLPMQALGVERELQIHSGSIRLKSADQLVVLSRTVGLHLHLKPQNVLNMNDISRDLSQIEPEMPFWLGVVDF